MRAQRLILVLSCALGLAVAGQASAQFRWPILPGTAPPKNATGAPPAKPAPKPKAPAPKAARTEAPPPAAPASAAPAVGQASGPDWRAADAENTLVIDTNRGRVIVELAAQLAPKHVERIKALTRRGFYNGRTFFRVIDDFMAQTGDPQDTGLGGSELPDLQPEFSFWRGRDMTFTVAAPANSAAPMGFIGVMPVRTQPDAMMALMASGKVSGQGLFCPGVAGMARADEPDSGNSQFFLMRASADMLNGAYTAFGRVLVGLDVVRSIKTGEPVSAPQDRMTTVRVLADMLAAERPDVQVMRTDGPTFKAYVERQRFEKGAAFDICDLEIQAIAR